MGLKFKRTATEEHYFAADYHWGHVNVLGYDNRPFKTIEEHDQLIIAKHNEIVRPTDHFWFIGDISLHATTSYVEDLLKQLKGILHFLKGNHDNRKIIKLFSKYGIYHGEQVTIRIDDQKMTLNHCRMYVFFNSHYGAWNLHGHSHGALDKAPWGKTLDVGINIRDYAPLSFPFIQALMKSKDILLVDHHRGE